MPQSMGMTRKGTGRIGAGEPPRRRDRRMAGDPAVRDAAHRIESGLAVKRADRVARPGNQHADGVPGTQRSTQRVHVVMGDVSRIGARIRGGLHPIRAPQRRRRLLRGRSVT